MNEDKIRLVIQFQKLDQSIVLVDNGDGFELSYLDEDNEDTGYTPDWKTELEKIAFTGIVQIIFGYIRTAQEDNIPEIGQEIYTSEENRIANMVLIKLLEEEYERQLGEKISLKDLGL